MNYQATTKVAGILARSEITSLRKGTVLRQLKIQKREYYKILAIIRSFDNKPQR